MKGELSLCLHLHTFEVFLAAFYHKSVTVKLLRRICGFDVCYLFVRYGNTTLLYGTSCFGTGCT